MLTMMTTNLHQINGFPEMIDAIYNCRTVGDFPQIDSAVADCGAVELDDLIFRQTSFPPDEFSTRCDRNYTEDYNIVWGFPHVDSATVDYGIGAVELDDLIFRRTSVSSITDWVTPLRTSPRTCIQLFLLDIFLSSLLRECGCVTGSSLSNDGRPNYA